MLRAPVLHAFVLLGTTCQLITGPRLTMPASGGMAGGPVSTVNIQDFSFAPATLSVKVGSTIQWQLEGRTLSARNRSDTAHANEPFRQPRSPCITFCLG